MNQCKHCCLDNIRIAFAFTVCKGLCKEKHFPKIQDYYGSGWVGPGLTRNFVFVGKSSQNSSKPALIFWSSILCILLYTCTLIVVSYYDLSVLSMSVTGFQNKNWMVGGWVG